MIVYGDPQETQSPASLLSSFRTQLAAARPCSVDDLRAVLIRAGQIEQALHDHPESVAHPASLEHSMRVTDAAAEAFMRALTNGQSSAKTAVPTLPELSRHLDRIGLSDSADGPITVKRPEGFAFYALFPEQYRLAALDWVKHHGPVQGRSALVVGIRSIGTTLSAVVAATLREQGWNARRFTVRPRGHAFRRTVNLQTPGTSLPDCALVVDEGPGLSGSSMASAARALADAGVRDIVFLPGHDGEPGHAAGQDVRDCWARIPRFNSPLADVRWNGLALREELMEQTRVLFPNDAPFDIVHDVSGGQWRRFACSPKEWPAVTPAFERMKFLFLNQTRRGVLWKFIGLDEMASRSIRRLESIASQGFGPMPLASRCGFIALPWIEGRRLRPADASNDSILARVADYVACSAAVANRSIPDQEEAQARLAEVLYWNSREAFGEDAAVRSQALAVDARSATSDLPAGDGRLAPIEWIVAGNQLLKTDCEGHDSDHTIAGPQSVLWDVAGVTVEWDLSPERTARLLTHLEQNGVRANPAALSFHVAAYAAFRVGMTALARSQALDASEQNRLERANAFYRRALERALMRHPVPAAS